MTERVLPSDSTSRTLLEPSASLSQQVVCPAESLRGDGLILAMCAATPGVEFELWTAFPRKALSDYAQTIADAQLQNAALTQSLK